MIAVKPLASIIFIYLLYSDLRHMEMSKRVYPMKAILIVQR